MIELTTGEQGTMKPGTEEMGPRRASTQVRTAAATRVAVPTTTAGEEKMMVVRQEKVSNTRGVAQIA